MHIFSFLTVMSTSDTSSREKSVTMVDLRLVAHQYRYATLRPGYALKVLSEDLNSSTIPILLAILGELKQLYHSHPTGKAG